MLYYLFTFVSLYYVFQFSIFVPFALCGFNSELSNTSDSEIHIPINMSKKFHIFALNFLFFPYFPFCISPVVQTDTIHTFDYLAHRKYFTKAKKRPHLQYCILFRYFCWLILQHKTDSTEIEYIMIYRHLIEIYINITSISTSTSANFKQIICDIFPILLKSI